MLKKYLFLIGLILSLSGLIAQDNSSMITKIATEASADSSYIAVNRKNGWLFMSSYLSSMGPDSVLIEMIVHHDRTIDWKQEQLVGRIKPTNLLPKSSQTLPFNLIYDTYQLRIEPNGKCFLRLITGSLPDGDPVIVPVRAVYKL
jgi:hypothetical protein